MRQGAGVADAPTRAIASSFLFVLVASCSK
jgi:hypothetical protein